MPLIFFFFPIPYATTQNKGCARRRDGADRVAVRSLWTSPHFRRMGSLGGRCGYCIPLSLSHTAAAAAAAADAPLTLNRFYAEPYGVPPTLPSVYNAGGRDGRSLERLAI
jgi:hypothetical protein